jgi:hypothetical protein
LKHESASLLLLVLRQLQERQRLADHLRLRYSLLAREFFEDAF